MKQKPYSIHPLKLFCATAALCLLAGNVLAKPEKMLVCHVGNQLGSDGATYLENPDCVPPEGYTVDDYVCPDAGKVDLIVVSKKSRHLGNESHAWDGLFDYTPAELGASGEGTEDTDGDGIDEGCAPAAADCPCWQELELQAITAQNINGNSTVVCVSADYPGAANIEDNMPPFLPTSTGFFAASDGENSYCGLKPTERPIQPPTDTSVPEAEACIAQIAQRCLDLCRPIDGSPLPEHCL